MLAASNQRSPSLSCTGTSWLWIFIHSIQKHGHCSNKSIWISCSTVSIEPESWGATHSRIEGVVRVPTSHILCTISFLFFVVVVVFVWVLYFEATLQSLCRKDCRRGSSRRRCRSRRTFCTRTRLAETKTYIWMLLSPFRITSGDSWYQLLVFLFCELLHSSAATHGNWFEKFDCQKNNPNFEYAKDKRTVYKPSLLSIGINRSWGLNAQYMTLSIIHGSLQLHPESQWRTSSTQEYKFQQGKCLFDCWKSGDLYFILAG